MTSAQEAPAAPGCRLQPGTSPGPSDLIDLAHAGLLGPTMATADPAERRALYAAAYAEAYPVVFDAVTRSVERRRGHTRCRRGPRFLADTCIDGYHDDVEALIERLLATSTPIDGLPAWLAYWAPRAAIDGNRRRRGALGALQRPRMTAALAADLGDDPWLMALALEILIWVGVPATAGADLWPLDQWALRRAQVTGNGPGSTPAMVAAEVERVLTVMRKRPAWYTAHVEVPLGRKPAPVAPPPGDDPARSRPLRPIGRDDADETRIVLLAGLALEAISAGLRGSDDPATTVVRVLTSLFLIGNSTDGLDRAPGTDPAHDERLSQLLDDPVAVARIVDRVLHIVREVEH